MTPSRVALALLMVVFVAGAGWGQSRIPAEANNWLQVTGQLGLGSRSLVNVSFFEVPDTYTGTVYFAVNDPTLQSAQDQGTGTTTFMLFGGTGALSNPDARRRDYADGDQALARSGTMLDSFSRTDGDPDDGWVYFTGVDVTQGERIGNRYYFKVVVEAAAGTNQKNAYQLDASLSNTGNPTGASEIRSFAYSWTVNLSNDGDTNREWNLYPFVPDGDEGDLLVFSNWDFDENAADIATVGTWFDPSATDSGTIASSNNNAFANTSVTIGADEDSTTWRARFLSTNSAGAGGAGILTAQIWHSRADAGSPPGGTVDYPGAASPDLYRTYAAPYTPAAPDHVVVVLEDGSAIDDGVDEELVTLQVVDADGNPVPFRRSVYVETTGSASLDGGAAGAALLVTTGVDGLASFPVTNNTAETVTLTLTTDGTNGSDNLSNATANEIADIVFSALAPPTLSSGSNTTVNVSTAGQAIADIVITENEAGNITTANDIRIRIPAALSDTYFDTTATVGTAVTGTGTGVVGTAVYEGGGGTENVLVIPVTTDFATGDILTISGVELTTGTVEDAGRPRLSFDGGTDYPVQDDKVIRVADQSKNTWLGSVDSSWNTGGNWSLGTVPTAGQDVEIPATTTQPVLDVDTASLGSVTVDSGASVSTNGDTFALNVSGPLTVNGTIVGTVTYDAAVSLSGNITSGGGDLVFTDAITLTGDTAIDAGAGSITFNASATVDGVFAFSVNADGAKSFASVVGGTDQPTTFTVSGTGDATLSAASYSIGGSTTVFSSPVVISSDTTISDATSVTFEDTVDIDSGVTLTVETPDVEFQGAVSGLGTLALRPYTAAGTLTLTGAGNISQTGGLVLGNTADHTISVSGSGLSYTAAETTLAGTLQTTDNAVLLSDLVLAAASTISTGADNVDVSGTVNGSFDFTVNSTGTATFTGAVGSGTPLTSITTNAGGSTNIDGGGVTTIGDHDYGNAVVIGAATTFAADAGSLIRFRDQLDLSAAGAIVTAAADFSGGTLDIAGNSYEQSEGDLILGTLLNPAGSTISFTGAAGQGFTTNGQALGNLTLDMGAAATAVTLSGDADLATHDGTLTLTQGTLAANGNELSLGADLLIDNGTTVSLGDGTLTGGAFNITVADGTLDASGTSSVTTTGNFTVNNAGGSVSVGSGTFTVGAMSVSAGSFAQTGDNGANTQSVASLGVTGGSVSWGAGSLAFSGALTQSDGTVELGAKTVTGLTELSMSGGTTVSDLGSADITVSGSVTFTSEGGGTAGGTSIVRMNDDADLSIGTVGLNDLEVGAAVTVAGAGAAPDVNALTFTAGSLVVGAEDFQANTATVSEAVTIGAGGAFSTVDGLTVNTGGSVVASGDGTITVGDTLAVNGDGSVSIADGDLTVSAGGLTVADGTGTVSSSGDGAIDVTGASSNTGTITGSGGLVSFGDGLTSGGTLVVGSGGARVTGNADFSGGTLDIAGNSYEQSEGDLILGTLLNPAGSTISFTGAAGQGFTT
ncbi:MAG: hypothetical protein EA383_14030, partial [Spirochaetaceae bacterium]